MTEKPRTWWAYAVDLHPFGSTKPAEAEVVIELEPVLDLLEGAHFEVESVSLLMPIEALLREHGRLK